MNANRDVRLCRLSDGIWYKFGVGQPIEATDEEVSLWITAQEKLLEKVGKPSSIWEKVADLAKWAAFFVASVTFLTLYIDWRFFAGLYGRLGVPNLAFVEFARNPVHMTGVRILVAIVFLISVAVGFTAVFYSLLIRHVLEYLFHHLSKRTSSWSMDQLATILCLIACTAVMALSRTGPADRSSEILGEMLLIASALAILWSIRQHWIHGSLYRQIVGGVIAVVAVAILYVLISGYPQALGREKADEILQGSQIDPDYGITTPGVLVITEKEYLMSDQVERIEGSSGVWAYWPKYLDSLRIGNRIPSLQYLGSDADTVYLLDIGIASIHAVPSEAVSQVIFLSSSETTQLLFASGVLADWAASPSAKTLPVECP